ncbi:rod shape-determining protein MreD [Nocardioides speluncae]|uniref:rod shape-determining protein MreD n=1 Tax=Nocardioides speluncae TaxID=2670337 RepID=UPI000D69E409|nr:rod shape-determining protein MreD [Nocardioides speluncae]
MTALRAVLALAMVSVAVVLQVSLFPHFAWEGVVPNLALLVVVAAALTRGPEFAAVLGFAAGLFVDLAPPADHIAGRWALALVVVGYVAGRIRSDISTDTGAGGRPGATAVVIAVAASSFIGTSVFALSGLLLDDVGASVGQMLQVILIAVVWDVLLTPLVLPLVMAVFGRLWPPQRVAVA